MNGRLLVVDDETLFRQGLIHLIRNNPLGWEVVGEAADGEEAIQVVDNCTPDLIITDINMPIMDGLDLAERIHDSGRDIMIIILTGYREFEYAQRAIRYGAIEFLLKPFSLDEACQVLRKAHERYRQKQSDNQIRAQYSQVNRTERLREELNSLLLHHQFAAMTHRIDGLLEEASQMTLPRAKEEVHMLIKVMTELLAQQLHLQESSSTVQFGPEPLLWVHHVPEVIAWARCKSEEWLDMLRRLTQEHQDHVITRVMQYVEMNYSRSCTLQSVSTHVHVTPNYLSHLFKKETGQGFSQYVSRRRIEKAKLLLHRTRQSMAEIAEQTGFDNSSYFTTVFKQMTGVSPREYRKQTGEQIDSQIGGIPHK
ncbi:response regulator [Paenibacillus tundrae]|uniref:Two-component system response regulator YesN n=1 Tax=Paenibacillus tundrae TaxID=528187 RepID=A0ABT9WEV8_9BACL|nr:response regulator [Paenibacillus tundrae]MDQ0171802.1 two-component system response regulator YesN [Paenibacillus tundrae]